MRLLCKVYAIVAIFITFLVVPIKAFSEPVSAPVHIVYIRPYSGGEIVFLVTDNPNGSFCAQSFYSIDGSTTGGKMMVAAAMMALASGKAVQLELMNCQGGSGGSNALQSIYVLNY